MNSQLLKTALGHIQMCIGTDDCLVSVLKCTFLKDLNTSEDLSCLSSSSRSVSGNVNIYVYFNLYMKLIVLMLVICWHLTNRDTLTFNSRFWLYSQV